MLYDVLSSPSHCVLSLFTSTAVKHVLSIIKLGSYVYLRCESFM